MKTLLSIFTLCLLLFSTAACVQYTSHRTPETVIVTPSSEQIIPALPEGYTIYESHGVRYYKYNNLYYQTVNLQNGKVGYTVVTQPL